MKWFKYLLLLLLIASPLHALDVRIMGGVVAVCSTSNDSLLFDSGYDSQDGDSGDVWTAGKITISNQSDITEYTVVLRELNATGSINVSLYTDSGDEPNTEVTGTEVSVGHASIHNSVYTETTVTLGTPKTDLASGTYWLVMEEVGGINNQRAQDANDEAGARRCYGFNGSDWTCVDNQAMGDKVYGCE